jgi:hypothetical protein
LDRMAFCFYVTPHFFQYLIISPLFFALNSAGHPQARPRLRCTLTMRDYCSK